MDGVCSGFVMPSSFSSEAPGTSSSSKRAGSMGFKLLGIDVGVDVLLSLLMVSWPFTLRGSPSALFLDTGIGWDRAEDLLVRLEGGILNYYYLLLFLLSLMRWFSFMNSNFLQST